MVSPEFATLNQLPLFPGPNTFWVKGRSVVVLQVAMPPVPLAGRVVRCIPVAVFVPDGGNGAVRVAFYPVAGSTIGLKSVIRFPDLRTERARRTFTICVFSCVVRR